MAERGTPRISINKLGEYLIANPVRRRRIISDQKNPPDFIVSRYRDAIDPMVQFMTGGAINDKIIEHAIETVSNRMVTTDFQEQDRALSVEALESFLNVVDKLPSDCTYAAGPSDPPKLPFGGVDISVRPDLILSKTGSSGPMVGAFKLYIVKTSPLTDKAGEYIGAVLQQYASDHLTGYGTTDFRLCGVIDVFQERVFMAPRSFRSRLSHVEAACEEIARAWPTA